MNQLDFQGLSGALLNRVGELLSSWLPGGRMVGREYTCGSLRGGQGDSCKVNCDTGRWADFASDDKGGDLVSLYAAIEGIKNGEAAKRLAHLISYQLGPEATKPVRQPPPEHVITDPPEFASVPSCVHAKHGPPSNVWCYKSHYNRPIFYVARYDTPTGKQFSPWSWSKTVGRWVPKGYPEPRPLYGLELLMASPGKAVLVVEGEKAADAARKIAGHVYVVVTWSNGSKAFTKTDWKPIYGRRVLIWPDWDAPGREAAQKIATALGPHCQEVKVIQADPREVYPDGWDAADAVDTGMDWKGLVAWAKPRAVAIQATAVAHANGQNAVAAVQTNVHVDVHTEDDGKSSPSVYAMHEQLGIATNGNGQPFANVDNALRVLERHDDFKTSIWYDEFHQKIFTTWGGPKHEWGDVDTLNVTAFMQRDLGLRRLSDEMIYKAVVVYANKHIVNEPRDWMSGLIWDGTARINTFFIDCFGAEDTDYTRAVSKNFWIGMVARIFQPGCKLDNMVVLEGAQGTYKSTALDIIGRGWYTEAHESVTNKDFFLILQGKLIVEIAELDSFNRAEVTRIKQVITCRTDRYRSPYGRTAQDHPRMSIFVGTTNEQAYLRDTTGGRRFWPIKCKEVKRHLIQDSRDQLFAEAVTQLKAAATWYEMPKEATEEEQERRRQADEWEGVIYDFLIGRSETTIREIATECLKIDIGKLERGTQMRIGAILRNIKWGKEHQWNSGNQGKVWHPLEPPF